MFLVEAATRRCLCLILHFRCLGGGKFFVKSQVIRVHTVRSLLFQVPGSANRPPTQSSVHAYSLPLQLAATGPPLSGGRGQPPMAHSLPVTSHSHLPMYPINMHQFGQGHTTTAAMVTQLHTATQPTVYHHHHHRHQPQVSAPASRAYESAAAPGSFPVRPD